MRGLMEMDSMYSHLIAKKFASVVPPPRPRHPGVLIESEDVQELVFENSDSDSDSSSEMDDSSVVKEDVIIQEEGMEEQDHEVSTERGIKRGRSPVRVIPKRKTARKRPVSIPTRVRMRKRVATSLPDPSDIDDDVFEEGTVDVVTPILTPRQRQAISISSDEPDSPNLTIPVFHTAPSPKKKIKCRRRLTHKVDDKQPLLRSLLQAKPIILSSSTDDELPDSNELPDIKPEITESNNTPFKIQSESSDSPIPSTQHSPLKIQYTESQLPEESFICGSCGSKHGSQQDLEVHTWCMHEQDTEPVKRHEVTMEMYGWGSVRRFMHLRKCKVCNIKIPCFFWIRHLNNPKHVQKVNSKVFVPTFHNKKTFLKDCQESDIPFNFYEKEEPTFASAEVISISSDEEPIIKCPRCPRVFHERKDMREHEEDAHESEIYAEEMAELQARLKEIDAEKLQRDPLYCKVCDLKLFTQSYMDAHKKGKAHKSKTAQAEADEAKKKTPKGQVIITNTPLNTGGKKAGPGMSECKVCMTFVKKCNWSHHVKTRKHRGNLKSSPKKKTLDKPSTSAPTGTATDPVNVDLSSTQNTE